jgi:methylated-DNA-protein-cysteine methyltransferase-like protein
MKDSSKRIIKVIRSIPEGQVMSYGAVARRAGVANGARMVARILHSSTKKHNLPWHRVVNAQGKISLAGEAYCLQKSLLVEEGIQFNRNDHIEMNEGS